MHNRVNRVKVVENEEEEIRPNFLIADLCSVLFFNVFREFHGNDYNSKDLEFSFKFGCVFHFFSCKRKAVIYHSGKDEIVLDRIDFLQLSIFFVFWLNISIIPLFIENPFIHHTSIQPFACPLFYTLHLIGYHAKYYASCMLNPVPLFLSTYDNAPCH